MRGFRSKQSHAAAILGGRIIIIVVTCSLASSLSPCYAGGFSLDAEQNVILLAQNLHRQTNRAIDRHSTTKELIHALENSEYAAMRGYAAQLLGDRAATEAIPNLLKALKDPEEDVQRDAAEALVAMGSGEIFEELIANLENTRPTVRQYSVYVLGHVGKRQDDKRNCTDVIRALERLVKDENAFVRIEAVYALSEIGAASSKPIFIESLKDDDPTVRRHSADALAKLKGPDAEEALAAAFIDEIDLNTRQSIASALTDMGTETALIAIGERVSEESTPVRINIAAKLGESDNPRAIEILSELVVSDRHPMVRTNAARGLLRAKEPSTVPVLVIALKDRVASVRIPASEALIDLADSSIRDDLLSAMSDSNGTVADNAARAVVKMNDLQSIHQLVRMLDSPDDAVRYRAIGVLEDLTYKPYGNNVQMWKNWYEEAFKTAVSRE